MSDRYPDIEITSRAWLVEHHATSTGIWLVTYKQPDRRHVTYDAIVDEALCFGWVDSRPRLGRPAALETPAHAAKARERLVEGQPGPHRAPAAGGLLAPVGAAAVRAAKRDGSWSKLAAVESLIEPDDLCLALDALTDARADWDAFPRSTKRAILEWISNAKKPETRARRVEDTAAQAARNIRAKQWRQAKSAGQPGSTSR